MLLALFDDIVAGTYLVENLKTQDHRRTGDICERYADADIGLVDAGILAIVGRPSEIRLVTQDRRHFGLLRPRHLDALRLLPG